MAYKRQLFEYRCAEGHANGIEKCYETADDGFLSEVVVRFPEALPCSGCGFKLVAASPVPIDEGSQISEMEFHDVRAEKYTESSAYHEAGHVVVAAVQQMPLTSKGIRIDQKGAGIAYYKFATPDGSTNLGSEAQRERTIRATQAGFIAEQKFYLRFYERLPDFGAHVDTNAINALLDEMYSDRNMWFNAKAELSALGRCEKIALYELVLVGNSVLSGQEESDDPRPEAEQEAVTPRTGSPEPAARQGED